MESGKIVLVDVGYPQPTCLGNSCPRVVLPRLVALHRIYTFLQNIWNIHGIEAGFEPGYFGIVDEYITIRLTTQGKYSGQKWLQCMCSDGKMLHIESCV